MDAFPEKIFNYEQANFNRKTKIRKQNSLLYRYKIPIFLNVEKLNFRMMLAWLEPWKPCKKFKRTASICDKPTFKEILFPSCWKLIASSRYWRLRTCWFVAYVVDVGLLHPVNMEEERREGGSVCLLWQERGNLLATLGHNNEATAAPPNCCCIIAAKSHTHTHA